MNYEDIEKKKTTYDEYHLALAINTIKHKTDWPKLKATKTLDEAAQVIIDMYGGSLEMAIIICYNNM